MNTDDAMKIAKRYPIPQGDKQFIRLPSIEVLHCWLQLNNRRVVGWRGDFLVVEPLPDTMQNAEGETQKVIEAV